MSANCIAQYRISHSIHLWQRDQQGPKDDSADGRSRPLRPAPDPVTGVLYPIQNLREGSGHHTGAHTEQSVEQILERVLHTEPR
ncbi:Uncharacterised protein [Mycobacteroides abscessus subsp. abscessus]|nr:Uncharacterised protein [Mycobacteroides abscessus subsp. abscessus]